MLTRGNDNEKRRRVKYSMSNCKYEMKLNPAAKEFFIQVEGSFTEDKANQFITDYKRHISKINPADYKLRLDSKSLHLVTQEMQPSLEGCLELYKQSQFGEVIIELNKSAVAKMQISRLANNVGLSNITITQS